MSIGARLLARDLAEDVNRRAGRAIATALRRAEGQPISAIPILGNALKTGAVIRADTGTVFAGEIAEAARRLQEEKALIDADLRVADARIEVDKIKPGIDRDPSQAVAPRSPAIG